MLPFPQQVYLTMTGGVPREALWKTVKNYEGEKPDLESIRDAALQFAKEIPRARVAPRWPDFRQAKGLAARLEREAVGLAWRAFDEYPKRVAERLPDAPHWLFIAGERSRLDTLTCSIIGSRQTAPKYLKAATALGRALGQAGVCVVSGLAEGADFAAQSGATQTTVGTIAFPARGILRIDLTPTRVNTNTMTALALDLPDDPISASKAVRRNSMIAAMGEGLVLVASTLTGGSSYAVRWALRHGVPLWAFESGRDTPAANRQLINAGKAIALNIGDEPEQWVHSIVPAIRAHEKQSIQRTNSDQQLDWLKI